MATTQQDQKVKLITYVLLRKEGQVYLVRYRIPPNAREGWWIPAPELAFGESPDDRCKAVLGSLGIQDGAATLKEVESFVTRDWHLLFHYVVSTQGDPAPSPDYETGRWFPLDQLPAAGAFAHGAWERALIQRLTS